MKKLTVTKILKYLLLFLICFLVYKCFTIDPIKDSKEKSEQMILSHCKIDWSKIDNNKKEQILNEYIEGAAHLKDSPVRLALSLLKESVKYPNTIEDGYPHGIIEDVENGIIEYQGSFTSENKLSMKVKGNYWLKIKYTAGCKPFEFISYDIE